MVPDPMHQLPTAVRGNGCPLATIRNRVLKRVRKLENQDSKVGKLGLDIEHYTLREYMRRDGRLQKTAYSVYTLTNWRNTDRGAKLWLFRSWLNEWSQTKT